MFIGGGGSGGGNIKAANPTADELEKIKKRLACEEDFVDEIIDIFVEHGLLQVGVGAAALGAVIFTGGTAAIIAIILAAAGGAVIYARSIYKVYAADRDRRKCLRRIG